MQFINESPEAITVKDLHLRLAPGEKCEIPDGYAQPRLTANGARHPSVIELLAPQLKPADPEERKAWLQTPVVDDRGRLVKAQLPTVEGLTAAGVPEGVAEQLVSAAQASRDGGADRSSKKKAK